VCFTVVLQQDFQCDNAAANSVSSNKFTACVDVDMAGTLCFSSRCTSGQVECCTDAQHPLCMFQKCQAMPDADMNSPQTERLSIDDLQM
jgi:hypothetical protein